MTKRKFGRCRFNTQPPEGGWPVKGGSVLVEFYVSTHSRPKAAGLRFQSFRTNWSGFNTQPPEGGWMLQTVKDSFNGGFNTQPPEGGWNGWGSFRADWVSFNTQPPEGGWPTSRKRDS